MTAWPHLCHEAKDDLALLILLLLPYTVQLFHAVLDIGLGFLASLASSLPTELRFQSSSCLALCNSLSNVSDLTSKHIEMSQL